MKRSAGLSFLALAVLLTTYACLVPSRTDAEGDDLQVRAPTFVAHEGLLTRNTIRVCTLASRGTLAASVPSGSGTVLTPIATIDTPKGGGPDGGCEGNAGEALFEWQGLQGEVTWTFAYEGAKAGRSKALSMIGTDIQLLASVSSVWTDSPEPSADAGPKPGPLVEVQARLFRAKFRAPDDCSPGGVSDAAANDAASDAALDGGEDASTDASNDGAAEAGTDESMIDLAQCADPVRNTSVVASIGGGGTPSTATFTTDANGLAFFSFRAPLGADRARVVLLVGGIVALPTEVTRAP